MRKDQKENKLTERAENEERTRREREPSGLRRDQKENRQRNIENPPHVNTYKQAHTHLDVPVLGGRHLDVVDRDVRDGLPSRHDLPAGAW
jgi:hypothetical protein